MLATSQEGTAGALGTGCQLYRCAVRRAPQLAASIAAGIADHKIYLLEAQALIGPSQSFGPLPPPRLALPSRCREPSPHLTHS